MLFGGAVRGDGEGALMAGAGGHVVWGAGASGVLGGAGEGRRRIFATLTLTCCFGMVQDGFSVWGCC